MEVCDLNQPEAPPMTPADAQQNIRVYVCDRKHPHYGESGVLTGKIISLFGTPMAEVTLDNCKARH